MAEGGERGRVGEDRCKIDKRKEGRKDAVYKGGEVKEEKDGR